jgi:hypothetical protein
VDIGEIAEFVWQCTGVEAGAELERGNGNVAHACPTDKRHRSNKHALALAEQQGRARYYARARGKSARTSSSAYTSFQYSKAVISYYLIRF